MPEHTALPTEVVTGLDHVRLSPHPTLAHVTVLSLHQGRYVDGVPVPSAQAWLSDDERRRLARDLDPHRPPTQDAYDAASAALWRHRQRAEALAAELAPAQYVTGPAGCVDREDRSCPEYADEDGNDRTDVDWCSHVQHRLATFADVRARERLEWMVLEIRRMAAPGDLPDTAAELAEDIDGWLESLRHELDMEVPDACGGGRQAYSVADYRAAAAELDAATQRWNEREGAEFARTCAEQAFDAREEATRLTVLLRERDAEIGQLRAEHAAMERALAEQMTRPCARCGNPVPAGEATCDPVCQPKATTGGAR